MEFIEKLKNKYKENEPIFIFELKDLFYPLKRARVYQMINKAIASGELVNFEYGVYYMPAKTMLGVSMLNPYKVIQKKYLSDGENVYGFMSGITLLNNFGLTTQVPNVIEVMTNNESAITRNVVVGSQKLKLKKSRTEITKDNYRELMILELFNIVNASLMSKENLQRLTDYMKQQNITMQDLFKHASNVPARAIKNLVKSEALNVII
ncbi:MAG: DUF6088 family protein [Bacillota bacterium]